MKQKTFIINRIIAVMLLTSVFTFAFVWSASSASSESGGGAVEQTAAAEAEEPTTVYQPKKNAERKNSSAVLSAQKRGFPLINLQDGKKLETKFVGSESATQSFASAQPLTMTKADLNLDGAPDLVVSYAGGSGGHLALYAGNPDALSARTPETFEAIKEGRFPAPFLPEATLIALPVAPDFIGTGDFNRDGWKDIVAAQRGASSLVLLAGNARGSYKKTQTIELPGSITALLAENIDPADGQADVAVALSDSNGAWLFVFDNQHDAFAEQPRMYPLPAEANSLALGQLDDSAPMDILAAAGGKAVVIHGSYGDKNDSPENQLKTNAGQIETLSAGADVAAVRIGHFIWDRQNQPEIALLGASGTIRILQRGNIDRRQYSEEEWEAHWTKQEELDQIELQRRSADSTNRTMTVRTNQKQFGQAGASWTEADSFQLSSGFNFSAASPASVFTSARMTTEGVENLIIADAASRKIKILLQNNEELKSAGGESNELSATGALAAVELDSSATPAAILPMRLSVMTRPGLVMLEKDGAEISYAMAAPVATFTVTKTADTADGTCNADCSLREAIMAANTTAGPHSITVPAGTYTLTLGPADDSPSNPSDQDSGDLDVRRDMTITGAGQVNTIIQAGTLPSNGIDRVFNTRQNGSGIPDISFSGVTVRHGRCVTAGSANPGSARCNTGGAGLLHSVDDLGAVTISDSTFASNWNVSNEPIETYLNGAGVFMGRGDAVFTNVTFSNNENGATGSVNGGDGGAVLFGFSSSTNINTAVLTNCNMTGNITRLIAGDTLGGNGGAVNGAYNDLDIIGGTYSNNSADLDGGAVYNLTNMDISNNAAFTANSAKRDGGGIWSDPFQYNDSNQAFGPGTNTIANATVRGNISDSDNGVNLAGDPRGAGGGIYHDRNTLTLTNVTIGGTGVGQPNTSYDGGGLGHRYRAVNSTTNLSTITINGSSIVGNVANNDGGGIFHDATRTAGSNSTISVAAAAAVTLTNNLAKNNGGGISNSGGASATLANMQLRSNQANSDNAGGGDGGALYQNTAGSTTTFTGTLTVGGSGFANSAVNGGGIRNNAGTVNISSGASITHNTATSAGGGISNAGTLSALATPTITSNAATGTGGGIHNTGTLGAITSPALNFNSASNGGGIFNSGAAMSITNGSISNNTATSGAGFGGGIEQGGSSASTVSNVAINNNNGAGIVIATASSLDAANNTITGNTGDGITKTGTGTGSHFNSNTIHSNGELGIDLGVNGVTANDANDADTGPNNLQNFPVINWVRRGDGIGNVTLNSPNGKYRIQYYKNFACDASGHGEGEVLMTSQVVDITSVATQTFTTPALAFDSGLREQITATATHDANGDGNFDNDGSTSEFSACRQVNRLPTFGAAQTISRQQGTLTGNNGLIAIVADLDQAPNTLAVTVNGGASATVNGVTVSGIAIDASGNVTATVAASCTATNATFTLRVTDTPGEFNQQTLTVNVTPNTPPTLGTYPNTTVNAGSSGTVVTPSAAPTDNGTVATLTAVAPGFTGTFVGNPTTGTLTVNNAAPVGTYTVTVTATDNCGATTSTTFQLTVNAIPTITGATISRQQGSPAANSQIATTNDNDQSEETLVVTVNGGASATVNGVTVSNIAVSAAGNVTADVVASCTATNAAFSLTVTDSNSASSNATLTVNVTPNTPPTVGTYSNASVSPGAGTTVAPTAAPADNGSISATASAPGFSGTLAVNSTTGVVTVADANPVGNYTVTVTFTDNCGTATTRQFTLTVTTPPTITAATGVTRSQGNLAASSNSQIATVIDADQTENTLVVTVNGGASATVNGVTVSNIAVDAAGNVTANVVANATATNANFTLRVTDAQGAFAEATLTVTVVIGGFEADVAPRPNGDGNGRVNGGDVTQIQRFAVGLDRPFQSNEFQRADSAPRADTANDADSDPDLGNGIINGGDVTQAQRYAVNLDGGTAAAGGPTGPPAPVNASKQINGVQTKDFAGAQNVYTVRAVRQSLTANTVTIAIQLETSTGSPQAAAISGTLRFVTTEIGSPTNIRLGGGAPAGTSFFVNDTDTASGRLGFTINAPVNQTFAVGQQQLLLIDFTIVGSGSTVLSFDDSQAQRFVGDANGNETPAPATFPGNPVSLSPTAASVYIAGQVVATSGRGVSKALVTITGTDGMTRTATTNQFGYFRFYDLEVGQYVVVARHKTFSFSPRVVGAQSSVDDLRLEAEPRR